MQTQLQMADASCQAPECRERLPLLSGARRNGPLSCRRCTLLEGLCRQVEELQEEVRQLHGLREGEKR